MCNFVAELLLFENLICSKKSGSSSFIDFILVIPSDYSSTDSLLIHIYVSGIKLENVQNFVSLFKTLFKIRK
jgi:hypothetical protein